MDSSVSSQDPFKEVSGSPSAGPHRSPTSSPPPLRAVWRRARQTLGHASKSPASSRPKSRRDSGRSGPHPPPVRRSLAILAEHVGFQIMFIPSIVIALLSQNLILGGIYRKSYRKLIYQPFSSYQSNYQYLFNTYLSYQ